MKLSKEDTKRLKEIEVDILKKFIDVCEKLNLRYYVIAGTLIGAVRHQGFIPWDDDIDVAMPRKDFIKFIENGKQYLPQNLFIQTNKTDPEFAFNIAKIRNSDTAFMEVSNRNCKINKGIFIDIFPLDNYPLGKMCRTYMHFMDKVYLTAIGRVFFRKKVSLKLRVNQGLSKMICPSSYKAVQKREKLISSYADNDIAFNSCSLYGKKEIVPWSWYADGIDLTFEGIVVKAPTEYHKLLTHIYGDYMQLPPMEKRVSVHDTDVIDVNKSYSDYING